MALNLANNVIGNIIMLSEGRPGVDQRMTLIDGILRVEVDKATFERMGLKGNPVPTTGRKHVMARYCTLPGQCHSSVNDLTNYDQQSKSTFANHQCSTARKALSESFGPSKMC